MSLSGRKTLRNKEQKSGGEVMMIPQAVRIEALRHSLLHSLGFKSMALLLLQGMGHIHVWS